MTSFKDLFSNDMGFPPFLRSARSPRETSPGQLGVPDDPESPNRDSSKASSSVPR